jgi:two-component system sensor histidine kinase KdpD
MGAPAEEVLAIFDHEVRNLSTLLQALSSRLSGRWDDLTEQERRQLAARLAAQTGELGILLQNLRQLCLPGGAVGQARFRPAPAEAGSLHDLAADLADLAPEHRLRLDVPESLDAGGLNVAVLHQVLLNAIANAARYAPTGTAITIRAGADDGRLVVDVDDQGPGVAPADRERAFQRLVRLRRDTAGAGLGLYVSRQLVEAQGGLIRLDEAPGGGGRLHVELPIRPSVAVSSPAAGGSPAPDLPAAPGEAADLPEAG